MRVYFVWVVLLLWMAPHFHSQAGGTSDAQTAPGKILVADNQKPDTGLRVAIPEASARAMEYYRGGNALWVFSQLTSLAVPAILLFTGFSARLRTVAQRVGRRWLFAVVVYFLLYSLIASAMEFPLSFYSGYSRQHAFGLSNQTLQKWLGDWVKSLAVGLVFGAGLIWLPYLLLKRSPRRWWLHAGLLSLPVLFFVTVAEPVWVAPLFNRFGPMKDKQLESQILSLASQAGIDGAKVFEVDKSTDTRAINAYVTGVMESKRIVLWDTLLAKLDTREVRFVMAHEMGHYVLQHVIQGIVAGLLGMLVVFAGIHRFAGAALSRFKDGWGFSQLSDVASLPLLLMVAQVMFLLLQPIGMALSRHWEHEADRFALELTRDNHAAATAFVRLQSENLANPHPGWLYVLWRGSHPSLAKRIEFANDYRPWERGEPLSYGGLFHGLKPGVQ